MQSADPPAIPTARLRVFPAAAFRVRIGVNLGEPIGPADDCLPGDIYRLNRGAASHVLALNRIASGQARLAETSAAGETGQLLEIAARLTFMTDSAERSEVLVLRNPKNGLVFAFPLTPLAPGTDYTLLAADPATADLPLVEIACFAFARGTGITLPGGLRRPIESLKPGDLILTRDSGPQPLRWLGHACLRAEGAFAPVVIPAGRLGNPAELVVSQSHRLFLYQRGGQRIGPAPELLFEARHLLDDNTARLREGGHVDYYSIVFDRHEMIFAEGVPCESLRVSETILTRLPGGLAEEVRSQFPGLSQSQHRGTEAGSEALAAVTPTNPRRGAR